MIRSVPATSSRSSTEASFGARLERIGRGMTERSDCKEKARELIGSRLGDLVALSHAIHDQPGDRLRGGPGLRLDRGGAGEGGIRGDRRGGRACPPRSAPRSDPAAGGGGVRRVRRPPRSGPCLRAQHHRRVGRRGRAGPGPAGRRARRHRPGARHPRRGGWRGQGDHARARGLRRRTRGHDDPPVAGRPAPRAPAWPFPTST